MDLTDFEPFDPDDLWTCGVCYDTTVEDDKISSHSCISKYKCNDFYKSNTTKVFYPKFADGRLLAKKIVNNAAKLVYLTLNVGCTSDHQDKEKSSINIASSAAKKDFKNSNKENEKKNCNTNSSNKVLSDEKESSEDDSTSPGVLGKVRSYIQKNSSTSLNNNRFWMCSVCEKSVYYLSETDITKHECMSKYSCKSVVKIDTKKMFYPVLDNGRVLVSKLIDGHKKIVSVLQNQLSVTNNKSNKNVVSASTEVPSQSEDKTISINKSCNFSSDKNNSSQIENLRESYSEDSDSDDDKQKNKSQKNTNKDLFNEKLIQCVHEFEAIWNTKLKVDKKSKDKKDAAWTEIAESFDNEYTVEDLKRFWKNLVDTHRSYLKKKRTRTGQARKSMKPWAHMEAMQFMVEVDLLNKTTFSNYEENANGSESEQEIENFKSKPKKQRSKNREEAIDNMAEAIKSAKAPVINLPDLTPLLHQPFVPPPDEVESFLLFIGCKMKKLTETQQENAMDDISDYFRKKKYNKE